MKKTLIASLIILLSTTSMADTVCQSQSSDSKYTATVSITTAQLKQNGKVISDLKLTVIDESPTNHDELVGMYNDFNPTGYRLTVYFQSKKLTAVIYRGDGPDQEKVAELLNCSKK